VSLASLNNDLIHAANQAGMFSLPHVDAKCQSSKIMSLSLSIVIPAYNEANRLGEMLRETFAYLNRHEPNSEVLVVDDGSTDSTVAVAERAFFTNRSRIRTQVIEIQPNRGKGHAVRQGLLAARAPIALFADADLATPMTEVPKLVAPIRVGNYDLVFGSRALERDLIGVRQPWIREQSGRVFNLLMRLSTGLPFHDTQCGFKAFRMESCRPIVEAGLIDRFGFDVELLHIAHKAGLRMLEQPIRWNDVAGSKVTLETGLQGFADLRRVKRNDRLGLYDQAAQRAREMDYQAPTKVSNQVAVDPLLPAVKVQGKAAGR
jgi:glycosyltransferase involved in cell wall biosynthesis